MIRTITSSTRPPPRSDGRPRAAVLGRVREEIADDLLDIGRIGRDGREAGRQGEHERNPWPAILLGRDDARQDALQEDRLRADVAALLLEAGHRHDVLDEAVEPFGFDDHVAEDLGPCLGRQLGRPREDLGPGIDRRHRRSQLVRQDADERVADRLPPARLGDVAQHDDRLVPEVRLEVGPDGPRRDLDPALIAAARPQLRRPTGLAEDRRDVLGILELREDLGVGRLVDVGKDVLGRRVGQDDPAVAIAYDDALAHRLDDRVELGGAGMLREGQPPQGLLGRDPLPEVAGDREDACRLAAHRDPLQADLDRDRVAARPDESRWTPSAPRWRRPQGQAIASSTRIRSAPSTRSARREASRSSTGRPTCSTAPRFA
jgi:hypothetical protein